jgi:hypothetical protein
VRTSHFLYALSVCFALAFAGCASSNGALGFIGVPTPSPTSSSDPLIVAPSSLSFSFVGQTQNTSVTDTGYVGAFSVSGCSGIVTSAVSASSVAVTAVAAGTCTLAISDSLGHTKNLSVVVTTLSVPVQ